MARIALRGNLFSGKSTLAEGLEREGYRYINYTDMLKVATSKALIAATGNKTYTVEYVREHKNALRPFIITLGTAIGFDQGALIPEALRKLGTAENVVFDNVRFDAQFALLREAGFHLVEVVIPDHIRDERARAAGVSMAQLAERLADPTENGVTFPAELVVGGDLPLSYQVARIEQRFARAA